MSEAEDLLVRKGRDWRREAPESRFWPKVDRSGGPDACWSWTASRGTNGYGQFNVSHGHPINASRYAWTLTFGDPAGLDVLHSCDNPPCCNPAHLFLGTAKDNAADMVAKGRHRSSTLRGAQCYNAKLNEAKVRDIRASVAAGEPKRAIARRLGIDDRLVYMVLNGEAWAHVE